MIRNDSSPKYKAGYRNKTESTIPLIFQEIELTARIEINNKYLLHLKPGALSNKKGQTWQTCIFYENVRRWYRTSLGNMIANCWKQVASLPDLLNQTGPPFPSFMPRTASFVTSLPRQGTPQRLITIRALLPCCHQLSLFLSNITLCCVTMATVGHHFEECNRETGGKEKQQSRAELLLVMSNVWGRRCASSHFTEGETEEWAKCSLWFLCMEEQNVKPDNHTLHTGLCSLVDQELTEPFQQASNVRETNKQQERAGALVLCRWTKKSLAICCNVLS